MKTQYYTASTLDGYIATSDHSLQWLFDMGPMENPTYDDFIRDVGAVAMGSSTYRWLLGHGIGSTEPWPYSQPTWVFSRREQRPIPGADIRFVHGDVRQFHADMLQAAGAKNVWVCGGGDLAGQFLDAGLLDEIIVQVASTTLGAGAPLLPRAFAASPLRLTSATRHGDHFAELRYDVRR